MSKANSSKQNDDDILRASDIMPPYKVRPVQKVPAEPADEKQRQREIPKFDLAEEIMSEQRKITAAKRKSPGKVGPAILRKSRDLTRLDQVESVSHAIMQPTLPLSNQQQIIVEIVAKDIAKLRGDIVLGQG
jgi:hypothetical protein